MKVTSDTATEAFHQTWLRAYGPPERLSVDAGGEFQGRFEEMCSIAGIEMDVVPPNAKWRAGLAERHGSIAKLMLLRMNETLVLTEDWEVHIAVTCVFAAKNRLHRSAGWSPSQVVFGSDVGLGNGVVEQLATGGVKFMANQQMDLSSTYARTQVIRKAACDAFLWLDSKESVRRALNARSKPPLLGGLHAGSQVYFFIHSEARMRIQHFAQKATNLWAKKDKKSGPQLGKKGLENGWEGPAVVVCVESAASIWVKYRGRLLKLALENVRLATPDELLGY